MIDKVEYLTLKARIDEEFENLKRLEISPRKLKLFPGIKTKSLNGLPLTDVNDLAISLFKPFPAV